MSDEVTLPGTPNAIETLNRAIAVSTEALEIAREAFKVAVETRDLLRTLTDEFLALRSDAPHGKCPLAKTVDRVVEEQVKLKIAGL